MHYWWVVRGIVKFTYYVTSFSTPLQEYCYGNVDIRNTIELEMGKIQKFCLKLEMLKLIWLRCLELWRPEQRLIIFLPSFPKYKGTPGGKKRINLDLILVTTTVSIIKAICGIHCCSGRLFWKSRYFINIMNISNGLNIIAIKNLNSNWLW